MTENGTYKTEIIKYKKKKTLKIINTSYRTVLRK